MDTRFLESFLAVAEFGSIAEAARRLNLTPAAVAQRLRVLERELGRPLIARAGRTVRPTDAGLAVQRHAIPLIRGLEDLRAVVADDVPSGQLRIGATATALTGIIPRVIASLSARHDQIEYFLVPGSSMDLYHALLAENLDVAIIMQPPFALPKAVQWATMREEDLVLLSPRSLHVLDVAAALRDQAFIRYDRRQWGGQIVDHYLRRHALNVREWVELDALDSIATLVNKGLGVAIVPDWMPPWPEGLDIVKTPLRGGEKRKVGVLWRQSGPRTSAIGAFVQTCRDIAPDLRPAEPAASVL